MHEKDKRKAFPYKGIAKNFGLDMCYLASSAKRMSDTVLNISRTESKDDCSKKKVRKCQEDVDEKNYALCE